MRIEKIRVLGFKSFAQKTELVLDPGITAIVGPNGCGKSNVIDAVKWVLGEQRPTTLRAKEMMDVIFAGSGTRKPLGMAEVSLVFDNSDGTLPVEMKEVVLTRRLYRSGESEYLLNGENCRLKDLRDVLMDTGSGLDALSIMEQGKIDAVLTADPEERRTVFEEAAGIGRFKTRRKETLRRLERIGDDLTRLKDVIEITEKQLRSLRAQASRAARYRELADELKKKRVTWALYRYDSLLAERTELTGRLSDLEASEAQAAAELNALVAELSGEESAFDELGRRAAGAEADLVRLDAAIRSATERAEHGVKLGAELADRVEWYAGEIRAAERRIADLSSEREALADELAALTAEADLRETELKRADETIGAARSRTGEREARLRELTKRREAIAGRRAGVRNQRASAQSKLTSGEAVLERIDRRAAAVAEERAAVESRIADARTAAEAAAEREADVRGRLAAAEEESRRLDGRLEDLSAQAGETDRTLAAERSRLEVLNALKARREGMDQPVKRVLDEAAKPGSPLTGVRGVVADLIRVDGPDAEAVELALGACAQGIVVESTADAVRAIEWLRTNQYGRAVFLPLSELRGVGADYDGGGFARPARRAVRAEGEYERLVEALLSDSVLVEDLDVARRLAGNGGASFRIVTGGGEILSRIGSIAGGRGKSAAALLTRNAEIEKLGRRIAEAEERRRAQEEALSALREARKAATSEIRVLREEADAAARDVREKEGARRRLDEDLRRFAEEIRRLEAERAEVVRDSGAAAEREAELGLEEERLAAEESAVVEAGLALDAALQEARAEAAAAEEERTEVRIGLARARERLAAARQRQAGIERTLVAVAAEVENARTEKAACESRRETVRHDAEAAGKERADGERKREKLRGEAASLRAAHDEAREKLLGKRREADGLRARHEEYRGALSDFRVREGEIRMRIEGLLERIREDLDLDLPALHADFTPEAIDWIALESEVAELKAKIDRMGAVNLEAIDQLAEVEERVQFLSREEADLVASREQLQEILRRVNRESRERFERAFEEIRQNFREMYRRLFGGGSADIILEEGQDVLEAGIEIVCRPPGRELTNLNLLSGGEKTLTAVALLFAVFKARPSPFALMDEVDAALDESNIDRFLSVLRDFTEKSQFVIITHNKRTMAFADALYGVTMPEPGVSQPVSVRFDRANGTVKENVTNGAAEPAGNGAAKPAKRRKLDEAVSAPAEAADGTPPAEEPSGDYETAGEAAGEAATR